MPDKSMVVYVYELLEEYWDNYEQLTLAETIGEALDVPPVQREHPANGKIRRLDEGIFEDGVFLLNLITFQFGGDGKVRRGHPVEPPNMRRDESFAPETAMLYCPGCDLVVAQSSRGGMSDTAISRYFEALAGEGIVYILIPRADPEVAARLRNQRYIGGITMRVSLGEITEWDRELGLAPLKAFGRDLGSGTIEITVKAENAGGRSLNVDSVQALVRRLTGRNNRHRPLEKLEVSGKQDERQRLLPMDMLQGRERHEFRLPMDPVTRSIPVDKRYRALQRIHEDVHGG